MADRFRVELLVSAALDVQADDEDLAAEQRDWLDRSTRDGVPARAVPDADGSAPERSGPASRSAARPGTRSTTAAPRCGSGRTG